MYRMLPEYEKCVFTKKNLKVLIFAVNMAVVTWVDGAVNLLGFVRLKVRTEGYSWPTSDNQCPVILRVPTRDWKTWKNEAFSSQGKVREFLTDWKSQGKVRENHTQKKEKILDKYYLILLVIYKLTVYYLLKYIKFSV